MNIDEIMCAKRKHLIAWLSGDEHGLLVQVRESLAFPEGIETTVTTYRRADVAEYAAYMITAACACGHRYSFDLALPMSTQRFGLVEKLNPDSSGQSGVSSQRRKPPK